MKRIMINLKLIAMTVLMISALNIFACGRQKENKNPKGGNPVLTEIILKENNHAGVPDNKTDIHTAIMKNDIAVVKKYIAAKSDLNQKESFGGSTPLIIAALFDRTEITKLLIDAGAALNIQNNDGSTALITAAFFCRQDIVRMLLSKHADKKIKNKYGQTAFDTVSASFKEVKVVYDMMGSALAPMGLKLDYAYIEKTRPAIAAMLK